MVKRDLAPTIEKVRKLIAFKQATGMSVTRSIGELVQTLNAEELCEVSDVLKLTLQDQQR